MSQLNGTLSPRSRKLLRFSAWAVLIVLILASLPFLLNLCSRGMDWITGLFPNSAKSWEAPLWLR